jgi:phage FluMu protein Com
MILGIIIIGLVSIFFLYYFKDNFIVICPKCKSINKSKLLYSSDALENQLNSQKGFKIMRQLYYVDETYICNKCGNKFDRTARKQDMSGPI